MIEYGGLLRLVLIRSPDIMGFWECLENLSPDIAKTVGDLGFAIQISVPLTSDMIIRVAITE